MMLNRLLNANPNIARAQYVLRSDKDISNLKTEMSRIMAEENLATMSIDDIASKLRTSQSVYEKQKEAFVQGKVIE